LQDQSSASTNLKDGKTDGNVAFFERISLKFLDGNLKSPTSQASLNEGNQNQGKKSEQNSLSPTLSSSSSSNSNTHSVNNKRVNTILVSNPEVPDYTSVLSMTILIGSALLLCNIGVFFAVYCKLNKRYRNGSHSNENNERRAKRSTSSSSNSNSNTNYTPVCHTISNSNHSSLRRNNSLRRPINANNNNCNTIPRHHQQQTTRNTSPAHHHNHHQQQNMNHVAQYNSHHHHENQGLLQDDLSVQSSSSNYPPPTSASTTLHVPYQHNNAQQINYTTSSCSFESQDSYIQHLNYHSHHHHQHQPTVTFNDYITTLPASSDEIQHQNNMLIKTMHHHLNQMTPSPNPSTTGSNELVMMIPNVDHQPDLYGSPSHRHVSIATNTEDKGAQQQLTVIQEMQGEEEHL